MQKGAGKGAFLSSTERTVPPHDVLMEQPDKLNPGTGQYSFEMHVHENQDLNILAFSCQGPENMHPLSRLGRVGS